MKTNIKSYWMSLSIILVMTGFSATGCKDDDDGGGGEDTDSSGDADSDTDSDADTDADSDSDSDSDSDTDAGMAYIRVLHLSPDAPEVDVYTGGSAVIEGLAYGKSSDYLEVPPGTYTFEVAPAGTSAADSVLTLADVALSAGMYYTAVAYNELTQIEGMALMDDMADLGPGDIRVRAIHAADGVGAVDIWNLPAEGDAAKLYDNVDFGVDGEYFDLPEGAYTLGFDVNEDGIPDLIFSLPALDAGTMANVYAVAYQGVVSLLAQLDGDVTAFVEAGESMVRVIHLSPDAPAVDVFANGGEVPVFSNLAFTQSSGFVPVASAGYEFNVSVSGTPASESVLDVGAVLLPGGYYTVLAYDVVASVKSLVIMDDMIDLGAGDLRVRAIHTAAGVGEVDIWNVTPLQNASILWEDVPFAGVGAYYDLPAGAYSVGFDTNNDQSPEVSFNLPSLPAETIANVFAVNDEGVKLVAQFWNGDTAVISPNLPQ